MKKKVHHHKVVKAAAKRTAKKTDPYIFVVRGWMFFVLVALMMGLGLVIGNYINSRMNTPQVAGAEVQVR